MSGWWKRRPSGSGSFNEGGMDRDFDTIVIGLGEEGGISSPIFRIDLDGEEAKNKNSAPQLSPDRDAARVHV